MKDIKVLIDTDIGDEIDDAWALYLAMKTELDIVGVTTVFQNTDERARICKRLLSLYGKGYENVPVYAGESDPIAASGGKYGHTCHYTSELDLEKYKPNGDAAVDYIIDSCKKYGKKLVIVAIGPFTNIAKAIKKDAEAVRSAGKIVIMGGAYYKQYADWNVMCDVDAARDIFSSLDNLECIGADVTHKLQLNNEQLDKLCLAKSNAAAEELAKLLKLWRGSVTDRLPALHDPLAIYYAAHPDVCEMAEQRVTVVTEGLARGITLNVDAYGKQAMNPTYKNTEIPRLAVARSVDAPGFIDTFLSFFE
ncbi:MAG: nucleoside hydrolase [Ruminococcaceae bacterium]|nr:nucleoside hydrolase [Oscillospiraceae bacterium]